MIHKSQIVKQAGKNPFVWDLVQRRSGYMIVRNRFTKEYRVIPEVKRC